MDLLERLTSKIDFGDNYNSCWKWNGFINKDGYGKITTPEQSYLTHRLTYELCNGKIPEGLELDHLCRNRDCCNPTHLEAVTHKENLKRGQTWDVNRNKTHCPKGHEYNEENTWTNGKDRKCRVCNREYKKHKYHTIRRIIGDE